MAKPRLIIVVRHAQSEGNKNRDIHQTIPDHRVKLTPLGWNQAHDAGRRLRAMLRPTDRLHFFTSPYRRTRETAEGILETLTATDDDGDGGGPSPFQRDGIKVYEEPRLREQDFGNFQPCSAEMERMWQERADYGHFFYRIPNGESAADAYDRVSGFNESLWRQFGEDDFADVCVLVTHGLMSRVFLMKWYHFTVEYFEDLRNINHCEFLIMRKDEETGKYALENQLRTWSELRRERQELEGANGTNGTNGTPNKDAEKLSRSKTFVSLRRWGGCPNGCNHRREYKKREDLETLRQTAEHADGEALTLVTRRKQRTTLVDGAPQIDVTRARDADEYSSPDGTPSYISAEDRLRGLASPHLHIGRDGGGTYSGHASVSGSDDEELSADEASRKREIGREARGEKEMVEEGAGAGVPPKVKYLDESGMGRGAKAHRLGDCSFDNSEEGSRAASPEELARIEREEKSVRGSVY